jgi:8-oxo-dGTP pyrophosphatase MutT (NUDIX family)
MSNTEKIIARGRLFELVELPQPDGRTFELARRAPGVRVIISDRSREKVLLTKEFRRELNDTDYRLPGGKVFDSLPEYEAFLLSGKDISVPAATKAIAESAEEAGIDVEDVELYKKSTLGATVQWDLFVFEATNWAPRAAGQSLEPGEQVEEVAWVSYDDAKAKILNGEMAEERIALILLQWLEGQVHGKNHD